VNKKRVEKLYREGKMTLRRKKRRKFPEHQRVSVPAPEALNEVWSIDFMSDRIEARRTIRIFNVIDDASRESLLSKVAYSIPAEEVTEQLDSIALFRGYPTFIRCDNGPEFKSRALAQWAARHGVTLLFIEPGKPHQNCFIEAFNGIMRDKCLNLHLFHSVLDAQQKINSFRDDYNHNIPHGSLGVPPAVLAKHLRKGIHRDKPRTKLLHVADLGG
jgi:putative transposase